MTRYVAMRPKMFRYLTYDKSVNKKVKFSKKCLIKQKIKFP